MRNESVSGSAGECKQLGDRIPPRSCPAKGGPHSPRPAPHPPLRLLVFRIGRTTALRGNPMRKPALVLVLVAALLLATAGLAAAVTNGEPDNGRHPYVGLLVFDTEDGPAWRCSGTLLSPTVVLTAGHCTDGAVAARLWLDESVQTNPEYPFGGATSY